MTRPFRFFPVVSATVLSVAVLSACVASPPASLLALPPAPSSAAGVMTTADSASVTLRPVRVPGYLDSLTVVIRRQGGDVTVARDIEWAERLGDGVTRVLAGALSDRLGPGAVLIDGDGRIPDADLSVDLLRMDPEEGQLVLEARWTLVGTFMEPVTKTGGAINAGNSSPAKQGWGKPVRSGTERLVVPMMAGASAPQVAVATTEALTQLADRLARAASAFPKGPPL